MSKKPRENRPYLPRVRRIELEEGNIKLRWILIVILLALGVVAIGYGLRTALNPELGWNEITVVSDQINCSSEFKLVYDFSEYGGKAGAVEKHLTQVYSKACEKAFLLFSPDVEGEGNVHALNSHLNETVTVDPVLYNALKLLMQCNNRCLFLAPVYAEYNHVFLSESDVEARMYDPQKNPEAEAYVQELMTFLSDSEHIRLELTEENTATLVVSDAYRSFAEEHGIENYLDFGWIKNAFIADFLAESLEEEGYTYGYLASFDGFTRNLDYRETDYSFNIFDRQEKTLYLPAKLDYSGRQSIVFLRDFPMVDQDRWHYYVYENGDICSIIVSPETGAPAASTATLISMSREASCAEMLMQMLPCYLTDELTIDAVNAMKAQGISSVWCKDRVICYNDTSAAPILLELGIKEGYQAEFVN